MFWTGKYSVATKYGLSLLECGHNGLIKKQERNPKGRSNMIKGHIFMAWNYVLGHKSKSK